tara:strand:+ start:129 stop:347 length:219 start_codon:yes stop_codon:yes gene_type:complete
MPKVHDWEEWDEVEEQFQSEQVRKKINHKSKNHNKKEWNKVDERIKKDNNVKYVKSKSKRKQAHKNSNHHHS